MRLCVLSISFILLCYVAGFCYLVSPSEFGILLVKHLVKASDKTDIREIFQQLFFFLAIALMSDC